MKSVMRILIISALGGALTLGAYKLFLEEPASQTVIEAAPSYSARPVNYSPAAQEENFVKAAEKTVHSVVHVKTAVRSKAPQSPLEYFFGVPRENEGKGRLRMGSGSGVIISEDGYIVTNNHVIAQAEEIKVSLNDGQEYTAEVVGRDPSTDIALLKMDGEGFPYLSFSDSDDIKVGEWVLAVGNPFNLTSTVTAGIVSAKGRNIGIIDNRAAIESFIQTDAAVNPGNSGGALVNTQGQLVGINSAISTRTGSFEGYSFAVPSNIARKVVEDLRKYGTVQRAFIGVSISNITSRMEEELDLDDDKGVYVAGLTESGAAAAAGIETGDIIVAVNDREVTKNSELQEIIGGKRPGDKVALKVMRDGRQKTFELTLRNANGTTDRVEKEDLEFTNMLGGEFRPINSKEANTYGLRYGVRVTEVEPGILEEQQVPKGFIITSINQQAIRDVEDINKAVEKLSPGQPVVIFGVLPDGREKYFAFGLR